jgi:hypothetical protein
MRAEVTLPVRLMTGSGGGWRREAEESSEEEGEEEGGRLLLRVGRREGLAAAVDERVLRFEERDVSAAVSCGIFDSYDPL